MFCVCAIQRWFFPEETLLVGLGTISFAGDWTGVCLMQGKYPNTVLSLLSLYIHFLINVWILHLFPAAYNVDMESDMQIFVRVRSGVLFVGVPSDFFIMPTQNHMTIIYLNWWRAANLFSIVGIMFGILSNNAQGF